MTMAAPLWIAIKATAGSRARRAVFIPSLAVHRSIRFIDSGYRVAAGHGL